MKPKENATDGVTVNPRDRDVPQASRPSSLEVQTQNPVQEGWEPLFQICAGLWGPYLDHGTHNLPGFVIQLVSTPARIQAPQLSGQPIVLSHKERVQGCQFRGFTCPGVTLKTPSS